MAESGQAVRAQIPHSDAKVRGPINTGGVAQVPARIPAPAPGIPSARPTTAQLPTGPGFLTQLPTLDLKSLGLVAFDPALQTMELRDKKGMAVRLKATRDPAQRFTLEIVRGREGMKVPFTLAMGRELAPLLNDAVARASKEPALKSVVGGQQFAELLAEASRVTLTDDSAARPVPAANNALGAALNTTAFSGPAKDWSAFASQKSAAKMAAVTTSTVPASGELGRLAPGLDVGSLKIAAHNSKGMVEMSDAAGNLLIITQTRFTPPPQFNVEHAPRKGSGNRQPVSPSLARELAAALKDGLTRSDDKDENMERCVVALGAALSKLG